MIVFNNKRQKFASKWLGCVGSVNFLPWRGRMNRWARQGCMGRRDAFMTFRFVTRLRSLACYNPVDIPINLASVFGFIDEQSVLIHAKEFAMTFRIPRVISCPPAFGGVPTT